MESSGFVVRSQSSAHSTGADIATQIEHIAHDHQHYKEYSIMTIGTLLARPVLSIHRIVAGVLFALMVVALTACGGGGDGRADAATAASRNFITMYYQKSNAKGALEFCTGNAKAKIGKEVAAIEKSGVTPDSASEKPTVTLKLDGYKKLGDDRYRVTWNVKSSTGQNIKVATDMTQPGDRWLVSKFVEDEK